MPGNHVWQRLHYLAIVRSDSAHVECGGLPPLFFAEACLGGLRMRREIKKLLGRKATDEDLSDVETWMEVRGAEEKAAAKKPPFIE